MIVTIHTRIVLAVTAVPMIITIAGMSTDGLLGGNGAQGKDDFPKKGSGDAKASASNVKWDFPRTATEYVKLIEP